MCNRAVMILFQPRLVDYELNNIYCMKFRTNVACRDGFTGGGRGVGCGRVCTPLALARGVQGGVLFFMIKQKIIRGKMRYSNLSNNMMISELCEQQLQFKYGSQARFCHDRHNSAPELAEHPPPYQIMLDPSLKCGHILAT
jgi:hypothetical protein